MAPSDAPPFELSRLARLTGTERSLVRREAKGELVRLRPGVYVAASRWSGLNYDERYRARIVAATYAVRLGTQFAYDSAAAMWRLPTLGPWSPHIHVLGEKAAGGRSSSGIRRHGAALDDRAIQIDGVTVTSLARTVVNAASRTGFARAVCMADDALREQERGEFRHALGAHAVSKTQILEVLEALEPSPGLVKARRVVEFATGQSGSIGESLSRVQIYLLGFPPPLLQVPFFDDQGFIGFVDFYWPEFDLVGEFDGRVKYRGAWYLRGSLPEEVVWAEKIREDRLRRVVRSVARWDWDVARNRPALAGRLQSHGLEIAR